MKKLLYILLALMLVLAVSCTKTESKDSVLAAAEAKAAEAQPAPAEPAPAEEPVPEPAPVVEKDPNRVVKTDQLTGLVYSNRKDTYAAYDEKANSQREKMGPAAYPNGASYERFQEVITDFMGTRRQAGYDYLISYTFLEDGYILINFGGEQMYGQYSLDGNNIYIDNGASLLGILSSDGLTIENKLIQGTLYKELPIVGTFSNSDDMMQDYLALFNEEMNKHNITSYDDEVFTDWFMLTYGNVDEYTEQNAMTVTFLDNGWAYVLKNGTSKFSQYEFSGDYNSTVNIDGVPMFTVYEGGYEIQSLFQYSILKRIEMPEETFKYL